MNRANFLPAPHAFNLQMACCIVAQAFGFCVYLVGSSLERRDYRDVDVRCILPDEEFDRFFGKDCRPQHDPRWSLMCSAVSLYLQQHSGLPVDFQFQRMSEANAEYPGQRRHALGVFFESK